MTYSDLKFLKVTVNNYIATVNLSRPKKMNAIHRQLFEDIHICFSKLLAEDSDVRVVILLGGDSKMYCSGIDLEFLTAVGSGESTEGKSSGTSNDSSDSEPLDTARKGVNLIKGIKFMQQAFQSIHLCPKPVISVAYNTCIGAGLELYLAADIRLCTKSCIFSVREPRMGLASDLGSLSRLPKCVGSGGNNNTIANRLCYSGMDFKCEELGDRNGFAECYGLDSREEIEKKGYEIAKGIAELSPIATSITKKTLLYANDHPRIEDSLEYVRNLNSCMLQSDDVMKAVQASMMKGKAKFAKL